MDLTVEQLPPNLIPSVIPLVRSNRYKKYQYIRIISHDAIEKYYEEQLLEMAQDSGSSVLVAVTDGAPQGLLAIRRLDWDSAVLETPCARIFCLLVPEPYVSGYEPARRLLDSAVQWAKERGVRWVDIRIDSRELAATHALESAGFRLMDASFTFAFTTETMKRWGAEGFASEVEVRLATEQDLPFVRRAARMFRNDRFHRDPRIPPAAADRLYEEWLVNSALQKHGFLFIALSKGRLIGLENGTLDDRFNRFSDVKVGAWDLTAILPHAGAIDVWKGMNFEIAKLATARGASLGEARTQIQNLQMFNLLREAPEYMKGELTFHGWLK